MTTRREFIKMAFGAVLVVDTVSLLGSEAQSRTPWKVGICDWDLRASGRPGSFAVAKELGFEGVQVSYQPEGADSLSDKANRRKFMTAARESGVGIASFCIGLLNERPLATTSEAEGWVENCLEAMVEMNVDQVLIPFFGNGDLTVHDDHLPLVVEKLKRLAPVAARNRKVLAVESYLSAEALLKLIDAVGSEAIKVYYDVRNSSNKHYDIFNELELLGKDRLISQIHFKEDRHLLGKGDIDFSRVRESLEKIDYKGWVVVESSTDGDWRESQMANAQFVKKLIGR